MRQYGDDTHDFLHIMDSYRDRMEEISQPVPGGRYEDIILQAPPPAASLVEEDSV